MKKDYTGWMELLNATGLGWDPVSKTMDADDDWWKNHLLVSDHVLYLQYFCICYFDSWTDLSIVFLFFRFALMTRNIGIGHLPT